MLTRLSVENFRAFPDVTVAPLAPLTLVYGPNNVGKSALTDALFWRSLRPYPNLNTPTGRLVNRRNEAYLIENGRYHFNGDNSRPSRVVFEGTADFPLERQQLNDLVGEAFVQNLYDFRITIEIGPTGTDRQLRVEQLSRTTRIPDDFLIHAERTVNFDEASSIGLPFGVMGLRDIRNPQTRVTRSRIPNPNSFFRSIMPLSGNSERRLTSILGVDDIRAQVNAELRNFGVEVVLQSDDSILRKSHSLYIRNIDSDLQLPIDFVGRGISQVLPLVTGVTIWKMGLYVLPQPELHLHPKLQAEIGTLLARSVVRNRTQLVVETHSEHILLRLQRLIRTMQPLVEDDPESYLKSSDVSVLYVSRDEDGSHVQRLRLDGDGDFIDEWPGGFFEERYHEVFSNYLDDDDE